MSKYLNVVKLDDNQLHDRFEEAFRAAGDDRDNDLRLNEVDVAVVRDSARNVEIHATVYGLAEVTTPEQFVDTKTGKIIKGGQPIAFDVDGRGSVAFGVDRLERKNSNDYVVVYKPLAG